MFRVHGVNLNFSTAYHPQSDGQTEVTNKTLETYLRCMTSDSPHKWSEWLPLAEWWYNTTYHTAIRSSPFEIIYGQPPPVHLPYLPGKLSPRFYGPYEIEDRVGSLAYKLRLPPGAAVHNVFHVSQLKLCPNPPATTSSLPQYLTDVGKTKEPERILEKKMVKRHNRVVTKVLVQWKGLPPDLATWEFYQDFAAKYPGFHT
ncbi:hypothetical protein Bca4012_026229 [Brassica carinata]